MSSSHKPEGHYSVTPYLTIDGADAAIDFYKRALGAAEIFRMPRGDKIGHAEIRIGDSMIMLSDEFPEMGALGPTSRGGATSSLMVYLEDVDAAFARAIAAGATAERPVADQFWGDRMGSLVDPYGHRWSLATHVRDVSIEEMQLAMQQMGKPAPSENGPAALDRHPSECWGVDSHSKCNRWLDSASAGVWKSRHFRGVWL